MWKKIKLVFGLLSGAFALLICLVLLLHFGPPGIRSGEDRLLSTLTLTDGSKLFLVAHRTGHPIDAYEVSLFRVEQKTNVYVAWLGHEDGYWWGASLLAEPSGKAVEIRGLWMLLGHYSISNGLVTWVDPKRETIPSYKIDGVQIKQAIPSAILDRK